MNFKKVVALSLSLIHISCRNSVSGKMEPQLHRKDKRNLSGNSGEDKRSYGI